MARFTQEDPIGLAGGLNLYGYAAGDPVNYGDPFGLCPQPAAAGDTIRVKLTVTCPNGSEEVQEVMAIEVTDPASIRALQAMAADLTGGSPGITPAMVQSEIEGVVTTGKVYRYQIERAGGYTTAGWALPGQLGFRDDIWSEIRGGVRNPQRGCKAVGHEGIHLVQYGLGWSVADARGPAGEGMAYAVRFGC